jgi:apolipoprotein D and lipocalin family protein
VRSTVLAALSAAAGVVYALGAGASEPGKPVDPAMFSGRWYQLGRMGADAPRPCPAATEDFASGGRGVNVTVICHPAGGGGDTYHGRLAIIPGSADAKFKLQFFGGLVSREYWTMNHAGEWALTMTPGGRTLYLMARHPALAASERAAAVAAIRALGFDPAGMRP